MPQEFVKSEIKKRVYPRERFGVGEGRGFRDVTINCSICSSSFVLELAQGCYVEMRRSSDQCVNESCVAFQESQGRFGDHILETVTCPRCGVFQYLRFDNPNGFDEGDFHVR